APVLHVRRDALVALPPPPHRRAPDRARARGRAPAALGRERAPPARRRARRAGRTPPPLRLPGGGAERRSRRRSASTRARARTRRDRSHRDAVAHPRRVADG